MTRENRFNSGDFYYSQQNEWSVKAKGYGVTTDADTPTRGFWVAGSHIPAGRFVAIHPEDKSKTRETENRVILPDLLGTSLINYDGSDYSAIISDALDSDGNFIFQGVSHENLSKKDVCSRAQMRENARFYADFQKNIPASLIGSQPAPIGYDYMPDYQNYWEFDGGIDVVSQGFVSVYTETDVEIGDIVFVRVKVVDEEAEVPQLLAGVTTFEDEGTQDATKYFKMRVVESALAGGAALIELR